MANESHWNAPTLDVIIAPTCCCSTVCSCDGVDGSFPRGKGYLVCQHSAVFVAGKIGKSNVNSHRVVSGHVDPSALQEFLDDNAFDLQFWRSSSNINIILASTMPFQTRGPNSWLCLSGPRRFVMGQDWVLGSWYAFIHKRTKTYGHRTLVEPSKLPPTNF